ncbi:MAG: hypothetical protein QOH59_3254 [Gemmatimonadales bacterium]|jgi:hypothetical protein|nr:hypothetical protein [Gemmatimonadales bacterium]
MRRSDLLVFSTLSIATACTGLVAGPESTAAAPVTVSRDSAYVRARRAVQAEAFTVDKVDSAAGLITGTRYASSSARLGSSAACRVRLALQVQGNNQGAQVATTSSWVAPEPMEEQAATVCEQERREVLARVSQTIEPPAQ